MDNRNKGKLAKFYMGKPINYVAGPSVAEFEQTRDKAKKIKTLALDFNQPIYDEQNDAWTVTYNVIKNDAGNWAVEFEVDAADSPGGLSGGPVHRESVGSLLTK